MRETLSSPPARPLYGLAQTASGMPSRPVSPKPGARPRARCTPLHGRWPWGFGPSGCLIRGPFSRAWAARLSHVIVHQRVCRRPPDCIPLTAHSQACQHGRQCRAGGLAIAVPNVRPGAFPSNEKSPSGFPESTKNGRSTCASIRVATRCPRLNPPLNVLSRVVQLCSRPFLGIRASKARRQMRHRNVDSIARTLPTYRRLLQVSRVASPAVGRSNGTPSDAWLELCLHRRSVAFQGTPRASRASYVAPSPGGTPSPPALNVKLGNLVKSAVAMRIASKLCQFSTRAIGVYLLCS